jgi:hypothetical protein
MLEDSRRPLCEKIDLNVILLAMIEDALRTSKLKLLLLLREDPNNLPQ